MCFIPMHLHLLNSITVTTFDEKREREKSVREKQCKFWSSKLHDFHHPVTSSLKQMLYNSRFIILALMMSGITWSVKMWWSSDINFTSTFMKIGQLVLSSEWKHDDITGLLLVTYGKWCWGSKWLKLHFHSPPVPSWHVIGWICFNRLKCTSNTVKFY
jgi:hypothetical protein